jgi:tripartite-type tricarboxylate transporter receptor subunit TctC
VVIPFAPGGVSDLLVRAIGPKLQEDLKQPIVVLNKPGANGNTNTASAMAATPDGYTLIQTPLSTLATNPYMYGAALPYKVNDLVLVSPLATLPLFLVVHPSVPVKNLKEFLAWLKANPGSTYGSAGIGGSNHLAGEMLRQAAGVEITHVPFGGSAPALNAVLGGHVQWMFDSGRVLQHVKAGKLVLLAVATEKRLPEVPDTPTMAETFPGFIANGWHGIAAPPNTPRPIVMKLNAAITRALQQPDVVKTLEANALIPYTATPDEYAVFVRAEQKKWSEVIRKANIKAE